MIRVVVLDFGTTRVKGAVVDDQGELQDLVSRAAPRLEGVGERRESSADSYLAVATAVRDELSDGADRVHLGLASQRSTFTVWERSSGRARLPLVSWQDRRARDWCARHRRAEPEIRRQTGLRLSPHYAGPKLAAVLEQDRSLHDGLVDGACRVGTLDTWVLGRWSDDAVHETDHTMAARTLMASARERRWLPSLTQLFGVPFAWPRDDRGHDACASSG